MNFYNDIAQRERDMLKELALLQGELKQMYGMIIRAHTTAVEGDMPDEALEEAIRRAKEARRNIVQKLHTIDTDINTFVRDAEEHLLGHLLQNEERIGDHD